MKNRMGSEQHGDLTGGVLKNKRRASLSQDVTQYCSFTKNTPFALSLSKGLMDGPFDKPRASGN